MLLSADGIKPGSRKVAAIREFSRTKNITEIKRFLGLTFYFLKFVPRYAIRARPLSNLIKSNVKFEWKEEHSHQLSFEDLKSELTNASVLKLYDANATETILFTDASSHGIAGILMQRTRDDENCI